MTYACATPLRIIEVAVRAKRVEGKTTVENCIGGHVNVLSDYKKS